MGVAVCTKTGKYVRVNNAFARILGLTVKETLDRDYWEITPAKYKKQERLQLESIKATGAYGPYEKEYINKDKNLVPVRLTGRLIKGKTTEYIWSLVEDLTNARSRLLFQETPLGLALCDMRGLLIDVNKHFSDLVGYKIEELKNGMSYWNLTPKKYLPDEACTTREALAQ